MKFRWILSVGYKTGSNRQVAEEPSDPLCNLKDSNGLLILYRHPNSVKRLSRLSVTRSASSSYNAPSVNKALIIRGKLPISYPQNLTPIALPPLKQWNFRQSQESRLPNQQPPQVTHHALQDKPPITAPLPSSVCSPPGLQSLSHAAQIPQKRYKDLYSTQSTPAQVSNEDNREHYWNHFEIATVLERYIIERFVKKTIGSLWSESNAPEDAPNEAKDRGTPEPSHNRTSKIQTISTRKRRRGGRWKTNK